MTEAFSRELTALLDTRELYRVYLVSFAGALLILIAHLAVRLAKSYRLANSARFVRKDAKRPRSCAARDAKRLAI